jgi:hypothetical protein
VPVAAAQPSNSGGGQNAQPSQIAAVGAYNQKGSGANGQNNRNNQNNQSGGQQPAVQAQQVGQSGHGGRGGQQPKPFQCRVQGCRDTTWHNWNDCLIFRSMTLPQRWAMVAQSNNCEICLKHNRQFPCYATQKPGGSLPCGENGCVEIHNPLLHEQRGWHGISGTLWEDKELEEDQLEETMVEQDVSVGELHTQDHVTFSSVEHDNKNSEIVPLLLIDGSASSSEFIKKENVESDENEIVKTEIKEKKEPDVVDAVNTGGAEAVVKNEDDSDSDDDIYEDANYYDSDSEYVNTAHDLDKTIIFCQTVCIKDKKVNVCFDYGAAFSMLNEKKAEVALLKGKGQQARNVVSGVPKEEGAQGVQTMPLATVPLPLAGGGGGVWGQLMCLYCLRHCRPWVPPPSLRRWPKSLTSPLPSLLGGVEGL